MNDLIPAMKNDIVVLRDGRTVQVTDSPGMDEYLYTVDRVAWYEGREVITSTMPNETIMVGTRVWGGVSTASGEWEPVRFGGTIVTDMSEISDWLFIAPPSTPAEIVI